MRALFLTNALFGYIHLFAFASVLPPEYVVEPAAARPAERSAPNREPAYPPLCSVGLSARHDEPIARRKEDRPC